MAVTKPQNLVNFGCLSPREIIAKDGSKMFVPCRKCAYCRQHTADIASMLTSYELEYVNNSPDCCTLFVTLTYSNFSVPKVHTNISSVPDKGRSFIDFVSFDGEILDSQIYSYNEKKQLQKLASYYHSKYPRYFKNFGDIPVLNFADVRGFLKRLRSRLYRKFKKRNCFRYAMCGEYGETFGRPHYHLLLFFTKPCYRTYAYLYLDSLWFFGRTDSKYFSGSDGSYIARYCVGSNSLCPLFSRGAFRARFRHSVRLGECFIREKQELFKHFAFGCPSQPSTKLASKYQSVYLPYSLQSTLFPKCRGFRKSDDRTALSRYIFSLGYPEQKASEVAKIIFSELKTYFECPFGHGYHKPLYLSAFGDSPELHSDNDDFLYSFIYRDVLLSKKFIHSAKLSRLSFKDYLNRIRRYYYVQGLYKDLDFLQRIKFLTETEHNDSFNAFYSFFRNYFNRIKNDEFDTIQSSTAFKSWSTYCELRSLDSSKIKKMKEPRTLCAY